MRWRRNADAGLRGRERSASHGGPEEQARWLVGRLRAGEIQPEKIAMAAYLGHPAACLVGIPPTHLRREPWDFGSYSKEILDGGPVSPRDATLFAADCAARALLAHGLDNGEQDLFDMACGVVEAARNWVAGSGRIDPTGLAEELWSQGRRIDYVLRADGNAFEAAGVVGYGCRQQPSKHTVNVVRYSLDAFKQAVLGNGRNWKQVPPGIHEGAQAAMARERSWQDAHFANALLAEEWPVVEL